MRSRAPHEKFYDGISSRPAGSFRSSPYDRIKTWSRIMTTNLETAEKIVAKAPLRSERFDPTSIMLHWLTVLLIVGQFTTIWLHEFVGHQTILGSEILDAHRTMGLLTWTIVLA